MPFLVGRLNKLFVALYKALGLTALALIFAGLTSYLGVQAFYLLSSRWVAPIIVSPLDDRVLRINTEIAEKEAARDNLAIERARLWTEREQEVRIGQEAHLFQERYQQANRAERAHRAQALAELEGLRPGLKAAQRELVDSGRAFSGLVRTRADALRDARLIEREAFLTTNHQLAEQAIAELSVSQRELELRQQTQGIERELAALDAAGGPDRRSPKALFTTRVLLEAREAVRARMDEEHAADLQRTLDAAVTQIDGSLARYDRLLATLRGSPWLAALDGSVSVAFVPYENLPHVREGAAIYGCSLGILLCRRVGVVGRIFQGEASQKHPVRQVSMRGAMVQLELEDASWARHAILHVGRKPLLF
jgi:hypothetical protein